MNIAPVLKCVKEAISLLNSAQYFNQHDMPDSVDQKTGEAIGLLKSTVLFLELESGSPISEGQKEIVQ
jgi:hypothetical protein